MATESWHPSQAPADEAARGCSTRRGVLRASAGAVAAAGIAAAGLAGCAAPNPDAAPDPGAGGPLSPAGPVTLGATTDIPVGGGKIFAEQRIVVTQPQQGDFKVFGALCPHQGCLVSGVEAGAIVCACHGSRFDIADGSAMSGPARGPLQALAAPKLENGQLVVG